MNTVNTVNSRVRISFPVLHLSTAIPVMLTCFESISCVDTLIISIWQEFLLGPKTLYFSMFLRNQFENGPELGCERKASLLSLCNSMLVSCLLFDATHSSIPAT